MICINFPITVRVLQNNERGFPLIFKVTLVEFGFFFQIESSYDIIVNCVGIGAAELLNDTKIKAKRGQVIRV
jgi:hypothetical protein